MKIPAHNSVGPRLAACRPASGPGDKPDPTTPPQAEEPATVGDRIGVAWKVSEGVADGVNATAGMAALGTAGLMLGGFVAGSLLSVLGVASATASLPALLVTGGTVAGLTVGGGLLGAKLGRAVSGGAANLAEFSAKKLGLPRPELAGPLAKGALATAALTTTVLGPLVLRSAAVAAGALLISEGAQAAYRSIKEHL